MPILGIFEVLVGLRSEPPNKLAVPDPILDPIFEWLVAEEAVWYLERGEN